MDTCQNIADDSRDVIVHAAAKMCGWKNVESPPSNIEKKEYFTLSISVLDAIANDICELSKSKD